MMTTISSVPTFIHNLDPVAGGASDSQEGVRDPRAAKEGRGGRKPSSNKPGGGNAPAGGNKPAGGNAPATGNNLGAGSVDGAPNSNVVKPQRKPGQDVDGAGWPLNSQKQRVDVDGNAIDNKGRRINDKNQLIDNKNQPINERGQRINDKNQLLNTLGVPVDSKNNLIDSQNRVINRDGRLIDNQKRLIDKDGQLVDKEGFLVDNIGRQLDKDGKVARSKQSAVLGNNEPHPQLAGMTSSLKNPNVGTHVPAAPAAPAAPKPSLEASAQSANKTDELVRNGYIPSRPELSKLFISGIVTGSGEALVAIPFMVAETALTQHTEASIKAKYLPVPLPTSQSVPEPSVSTAPGSEVGKAEPTEEVKKQDTQNAAINTLQPVILKAAGELDALLSGKGASEIIPTKHWPADPLGRLDQLEEVLDKMEEQAVALAKKHELGYTVPPIPEIAPEPGTDGIDARIAALQERSAKILKFIKRVQKEISDPSD